MSYQYGDVILVHGENLFSEGIQSLTGSFYSHAAMCIDEGKIIQMMRGGLDIGNNTYISGSRAFIVLRHKYLYYSDVLKIKRVLTNMKAYVMKLQENPPKYDYFELVKQAVHLIKTKGKSFTRDNHTLILNSLLDAGDRLICSALIDSIYEHVGLDLFPKHPPFSTTPADLAYLASGNDPTFLVVDQYLPVK